MYIRSLKSNIMRHIITAFACLLSFSVFGQGWEIAFEKPESQHGHSVQQTTDGGYIIGGTSWSNETGDDVYLIKTDSEGTLSSSFTITTPSSNRKLEKVIDALGREVNHTTNQILFHLYDDGSVEKKFVVE